MRACILNFSSSAKRRSYRSRMSRTVAISVASCELSLTDHCNLSCGGCNHSSPHLPKRFSTIDGIQRDLQALQGVLSADMIRLAGGEPLLHPKLLDVVRIARDSGVARKIVVNTNGVLLHRVPQAIWKMIDGLWISLHPGTKYRWRSSDIQSLCDEHGIHLWMKETPLFRRTVVNDRIPDWLTPLVYRNCCIAHEWSCHLIHQGRFYICPTAAFMEERLERSGVQFTNKEQDGVALHNNPRLRDELAAYLANKKVPLKACSHCLGTIGRKMANRQLDVAGRRAELDEPNSRLWSLVSAGGLVRSMLLSPMYQSRIYKDLRNRLKR